MSSYTAHRMLTRGREPDWSRVYDASDVEGGKLMALLCYLPISPVNVVVSIICLAQRNNAFSLYHAKQSLALFFVTVLTMGSAFAIMMLAYVYSSSAIGMILGVCLYGAGGLFCFVLMILGLVNASSGKYKPLPFIGGVAAAMFGRIRKA